MVTGYIGNIGFMCLLTIFNELLAIKKICATWLGWM